MTEQNPNFEKNDAKPFWVTPQFEIIDKEIIQGVGGVGPDAEGYHS